MTNDERLDFDFFVFGYFSASSAEFFKEEFFFSIFGVFGRGVVSRFANCTFKSN